MLQASAGDPPGQNPSFFSLKPAEQFGVFKIHVFDFVFAKTADFMGDGPFPGSSSSWFRHILSSLFMLLINSSDYN
jgi:hypothetical protein